MRILLAGQAGGRASAGAGAAEAIDGRCAADDAQRVHIQLDTAAGGEKVIYTYHLTRFNIALFEHGTPQPDGR